MNDKLTVDRNWLKGTEYEPRSYFKAALLGMSIGIIVAVFLIGWIGPRPMAHKTASTSLGTFRVSAYCLCDRCINVPEFRDGKTASGKRAVGKIIAGPPEMPFGTRLMVPGYGVASVEDRGSAIKGRRLDVFFGDDPISGLTGHDKALNWGVQHLEIKSL